MAGIKNGNSANNSAKSYNLVNAIKGIYRTQEVNYPLIRLIEGSLALPLNPVAVSVAGGFQFNWDYDPYDSSGNGYDKTMRMAYFPVKNVAFYVISGVPRSAGTELLPVIPELTGYEAETNISFITDDRIAISNSVYTGEVLVL